MVLFPQLFGPAGLFSGFFLSPQNLLFALAFIIPLILLYLIRPKPVNVAVPSLMFILNDMGKSNVHRFFRTIFRDILFLLQALAILLLALALAKPYIEVSQEALVRQSIIVIDASASTKAFDGSRFDMIKERAAESLAGDNIVIVARASPYALEENGDPHLGAGDANDLIDELQATDMDGDIPGALDIAAQYVGPDSKVTVISDFVLSDLESPELIEAKLKLLRSKGALIELIPITGEGRNIGIVDAELSGENASVAIKIQNFNPEPMEFGLEYNGDEIAIPQPLLAPAGKPGSLLVVNIPVAHGQTELLLTPEDDFAVDNMLYLSVHERAAVRVLLISNDPEVERSRVVPALQAAGDQFTNIEIEYAVPPKIPDLRHDIYVIKDVQGQFILPGVMRDLHDRVEEGAIVVFLAQPSLFSFDSSDLLPVAPKDAPPLTGKNEIIVNSSLGLLRGLSYIGQVDGNQLMRVRATEGASVHASVMTNDGPEPVIAHKRIGKGAVLYYGITDQRAVDLDPQSYAVIWGRIVDLTIPDSKLLNVPTGAVITSTSKSVSTPSGKRQSPVVATEAGFYQAGQTAIAANLYPLHTASGTTDVGVQYESDISVSAEIDTGDAAEGIGGDDAKMPLDLSTYLIVIGMIAMLFELLYVKFRGDL